MKGHLSDGEYLISLYTFLLDSEFRVFYVFGGYCFESASGLRIKAFII